MSKDGLCVIVTGSASGLGAATAGILAKGGARIVVNYSNSKNEAEATAEPCRKAGAAGGRGRAGRRLARRGLQEDRRGCRALGPARRADQQCRHHQACRPRQARRAFGRGFPAHLCGQHHRAVPDGACGARAAGSRRQGVGQAGGRGQHLVGSRHHRRRLVGRLCREQGRAQHHDACRCRARWRR